MTEGTGSATKTPPRLRVLDGRLTVCRLDPTGAVPAWASGAGFYSVTRTAEELSVVCQEENIPAELKGEAGWRALKLDGPFDLAEVGVLLSVAAPLAKAGVSIFAVSTFDTDYVLVKAEQLDDAIAALRGSGHEVQIGGTVTGAAFGIRLATEEDEPFLWEMLCESVHWGPDEPGPKPPPEELLSRPDVRRYLVDWGRAGDSAVVALDSEDGCRIGAAWYRLFSASDPGYGFVDSSTPDLAIAVAPTRRGRGVGGSLFSALLDAARSQGFDALSLGVLRDNKAAIALYERSGFVRVSDADARAWVMKIDLTDAAKEPGDESVSGG